VANDSTAGHIDLHTGAWRRDYFEAHLGRTLSEQRRNRQNVALVRIDVDDLQEANDRHGESVLNGALARLVELIAECVDGRGPIGRLGGDDFAVLLSNATQEDAMRLAESIREKAGAHIHAGPAETFHLTVSVGVALSRAGEPSGNLLDAAEAACLKAKQGGRNALVKR
jgi:diguanylate cyclase (GGDEF)-like protein